LSSQSEKKSRLSPFLESVGGDRMGYPLKGRLPRGSFFSFHAAPSFGRRPTLGLLAIGASPCERWRPEAATAFFPPPHFPRPEGFFKKESTSTRVGMPACPPPRPALRAAVAVAKRMRSAKGKSRARPAA